VPQWIETGTQALFLPSVFAPVSWEIDSSLELIADHWSAQMADSLYFRIATRVVVSRFRRVHGLQLATEPRNREAIRRQFSIIVC
jgi:hypothetical protein